MILGLESSCDETALALFDPNRGIVGEWIYSQIQLHSEYGGVVPDLASREHALRLRPMLENIWREQAPDRVDRIAVTEGPGLAACLAVGIATAEALALALNIPVTGVNHLHGHLWSPFIHLHRDAPDTFHQRLKACLPHLGLLVSGGNTLLFQLDTDCSIRVLARTVDDAAGEALDKGAKLLGLGYPGGPLVEQAASGGDAGKHAFPAGLASAGDMRFSFSGLKTSLRYRLEKMSDAEVEREQSHLCAGYQAAVVSQLVLKTRHALQSARYRSLGLSGGVANNAALRSAFAELAEIHALPLFAAASKHSGDNAAMIAFAAWMAMTLPSSDHSGKPPRLNPSLGLS